MVPNVSRGQSFKGLVAYLSHDKREELPDGATRTVQTDERVGFTQLLNFAPGEAVTLEEAAKVMASAEVKERLDKLGAEAFVMAPAAFDRFIVDETAKTQQLVKAAGIKLGA